MLPANFGNEPFSAFPLTTHERCQSLTTNSEQSIKSTPSLFMEYLTLQDIPHRLYDPLHSRRMAHSQSTERQVGGMAVAVSPQPPSSLLLPSPRRLSGRRPQLPPLTALAPHDPDLGQERPTERRTPPPTFVHYGPSSTALNESTNDYDPTQSYPPIIPTEYCDTCSAHTPQRPSSPDRRRKSPSFRRIKHTFHCAGVTITIDDQAHEYPYMNAIDVELREKATNLTEYQNMRSSPPIQPNEHAYADKLPSFSEVCSKFA